MPAEAIVHPDSARLGLRLGRYELLTELAQGGMATVYVARAQGVAGFERLVAAKVMHPHLAHEEEFVAMFLDEARLAARIRHPNVVSTLDILDDPTEGLCLVMDYVEGDHLGGLLAKAIRAGRPLAPDVVVRIVLDALAGLTAAHELVDEAGRPLGLVHRDLSPHNLLVGTDGAARLTDFGVAKAEDRIASTRAGQVKGKLAYMAPEQTGGGPLDARTDVFAMGIVTFEALTSRRLFRAESSAATLAKLLHEPIPAPSDVDPSLAPFDAAVGRALARDPAVRFPSAAAFAEALERAALDGPGIASARTVGAVVRALAATKLDAERARTKAAIAGSVGGVHSETRIAIPQSPTPGAIPSMKTASAIPIPAARTDPRVPLAGTASRIVAMPPLPGEASQGQVVYVEAHSGKSTAVLVVALLLAAGAAAVAGYFASRALPGGAPAPAASAATVSPAADAVPGGSAPEATGATGAAGGVAATPGGQSSSTTLPADSTAGAARGAGSAAGAWVEPATPGSPNGIRGPRGPGRGPGGRGAEAASGADGTGTSSGGGAQPGSTGGATADPHTTGSSVGTGSATASGGSSSFVEERNPYRE